MSNAYRSNKGASAILPTGDAVEANVLAGKTFSNALGTGKTGSMTNNGAVTQTIAPGGSYTIPEGYHNGSGVVSASQASDPTDVLIFGATFGSGGSVGGYITEENQTSQNWTTSIPAGYFVSYSSTTFTFNKAGHYMITYNGPSATRGVLFVDKAVNETWATPSSTGSWQVTITRLG